jgi:hypothetical protein
MQVEVSLSSEIREHFSLVFLQRSNARDSPVAIDGFSRNYGRGSTDLKLSGQIQMFKRLLFFFRN